MEDERKYPWIGKWDTEDRVFIVKFLNRRDGILLGINKIGKSDDIFTVGTRKKWSEIEYIPYNIENVIGGEIV